MHTDEDKEKIVFSDHNLIYTTFIIGISHQDRYTDEYKKYKYLKNKWPNHRTIYQQLRRMDSKLEKQNNLANARGKMQEISRATMETTIQRRKSEIKKKLNWYGSAMRLKKEISI